MKMNTPDFFGVGPKIGRIVLPWFAVTIILNLIFPSIFTFGHGARKYLLVAGIIVLVVALPIYLNTARSLIRGLNEKKLVTSGSFRYCQNPLYALIILLIIPGIGFLLNSWIILTVPVVGYIVFKKCIRKEYSDLTELFGDEYRKYREKTPEFFPFRKKQGAE